MVCSTWKSGFEGLYPADAQLVANEIICIGESATPKQIVDRARDEKSELHKCFEWDDTIAAEKYRLHQARLIVCHLVIKRPEEERDRPERRVFYKPKDASGYRPLQVIVQHKDEYEALLQRALAELQAFKRKYSSLSELEEILALID